MIRASIIASVYDKNHPLSGTTKESQIINSILNGRNGENEWKCFPVWHAGIKEISAHLQNSNYTFQIFHFAGHALDEHLQFAKTKNPIENLEIISSIPYLVDPGKLANLLTRLHDIKLVFLNGCSTSNQVKKFIEAGVPAIISTNYPLIDEIGTSFAQKFYDSFFNNNRTLEEAFDITTDEIQIKVDNIRDSVINRKIKNLMIRGGLNLELFQDQPLYKLTAGRDFKKMKLKDWPLPSNHLEEKIISKKKLYFIPEEKAWLCNRQRQVERFTETLNNVIRKDNQNLPFLLFIHDLDKACPSRLSDRFKTFEIPSFLQGMKLSDNLFEWRNIKLPEWGHMENDFLCLERLKEIYQDVIKINKNERKLSHLDHQVIIHHDLNILQIEWNERLELLFNVYINDFSRLIADDFSLVKIVVFSVEYYNVDDPFVSLFKKLENDHPNRVINLTNFLQIKKTHAGNWRRLVFKDFSTRPSIEEVFPFATTSVSMENVIEVLSFVIRRFNKKIV